MSKIFRHHKGNNNLKDWDVSTAYKTNTIDQITDPNGGNANNEITSIPSPFARMDLVKTAFKELSKEGVPLDGSTIYHKMVSHSLDVGQIFFNFSQFKGKLNILSWDKKTDLDTLLNSPNSSHKLYGKTLELFLKQDANAYNFDSLQRIFLLEQPGHGSGRMHVIGGTSPATLFFASANDLSTSNFSFDADITFDDEYRSLDKRDNDYIRFWFFLRNCIPSFSSKFPEVDTYLTRVSAAIDDTDFRAELNNLNDDQYKDDLVSLTADGFGVPVEVCGFSLRQKNIETIKEDIPNLSGFVIETKKEITKPPLVLPNTTNTEGIAYINEPWPSDLEAPHYDSADIGDRVLPGISVPYPYLTASDLLEPYLIRVPYEIDSDKFYTGNNKTTNGQGYLLPLKKEVFNYFDEKEIENGIGGNSMVEFQDSASGVLVVLRIPIKNGKTITFQRKYSEPANASSIAEVDENANKGAIIPILMTLNVVPFVRPTYMDGIFKVSLIDLESSPLIDESAWDINFLTGNEILKEQETFQYTAISKKEDGRQDELKHFEVKKNFEALEIQNGVFKALILPKFKDVSAGTTNFNFAIDFGTSNTHIEYNTGDSNNSKPFEITKEDTQVVSLFKDLRYKTLDELAHIRGREFLSLVNNTILPFEVNKSSLFSYPVRTAIQFNRRFNFNSPQSAFITSSIPYYLYKERSDKDFKVFTDLKWDKRSAQNKDNNNKERVLAYFDNMLFMIRNKVFLNGGNLENTQLTWTFPSSMTDSRINHLESLWNNLFVKYFPNSKSPLKVSESIAPFAYYQKQGGVVAQTRAVIGLDIGGGTSDLVIYEKDKPVLISSYKFAGNAIFGDSYNCTSSVNGFTNKYSEVAKDFFNDNSDTSKQISFMVNRSLVDITSSSDFISMLFSLEENKSLLDQNVHFKFSQRLAEDDTFKMVFFIFYAAQFYHIANIFKDKGIDSPRYMVLSGTASKTIGFLDSSSSKKNVLNLFNKIFTYVSDEFTHKDVEIKHDADPKEITAKGSLLVDDTLTIDPDTIYYVNTSEGLSENLTYKQAKEDNTLQKCKAEYHDFIALIKHLSKEIELDEKFGISSKALDIALNLLPLDYEDTLLQGVDEKMAELDASGDKKIKETLFFYPLVGRLNKIAYELYENSK